jgi:tetratricopeptide (TPR) repeat protein
MRCHPSVFLLLVLSTSFVFARQQAADDSPELVLGIEAYKGAKYSEATQHFERAVASEPTNVKAHLYLANSYAEQFIPGSGDPNNMQLGNVAVEQYKKVLELDSENLEAVKGLAQLYFNMKELEQATEVNRRAIEIDPKDPEPYYFIAVIDWTRTYQPRMKQRAKLKLRTEQPMIFAQECWTVRQANWERVVEGFDMLRKAIDLRPHYDDAMAYMNLMYRERADIDCGDPKARAYDLTMADKWVDMTLAIKKQKAEKAELEEKKKLQSDRQDESAVELTTAPNPQ